MNTAELIIEIFVEELPFSGVEREIENVLPKFKKVLATHNLEADLEFFWTPRRLILHSLAFALKQNDREEEFFGPPINIAYKDGILTNAGQSFIKKMGVRESEISKKIKDGKECLFYSRLNRGKESAEILQSVVGEWLEALHFGKSMKWGSVESAFIRPIRNITILLGERRISVGELESKYEFKSSEAICPHRNFNSVVIKNASEYFGILRENGVLYDQNEREAKILRQIKDIESKHKVKVEIDTSLLREIVAINEYPNAVYGEFSEAFLELPDEVIITSMKVNQKYFSVYKNDDSSKLHNAFIFVCNGVNEQHFSEVLDGNLKVLKARLEDALFFYRNDLESFTQNGADSNLGNIEFIAGCGSMLDKVAREAKIAEYFIKNLEKIANIDSDCVRRAINLSKNDLLSEMVGEFGELQGIMGGYYANESECVKNALKSQYLPLGESDEMPKSLEAAIVSISGKLDSIFSLFGIGKIPSGSKDPFALRRACNGIIRIVMAFEISFDLEDLIENLGVGVDKNVLSSFFYERLEGMLSVNSSIISAARKSNQKDLLKLIRQIEALSEIVKSKDSEEFKSLFKRVSNILKDSTNGDVRENLFESNEEKALYAKLLDYQKQKITSPKDAIASLLDFKDVLKNFFDNVLINAEDKAIRENRILLVRKIYEEFLKVGDIREISF